MEGYDTSGEAQSVARRRKMLEAMMAQSRQPLVGRSGPAQAIAQMLTGVLLDRQQGQVDQQDADGRVKYGTELGNETNQYLERMTGKPGEQMSPGQVDALMNQDQAPQLADPVAANPREAIVRAMTSQKPELRALGKAGMAEYSKSLVKKEPVPEKFGHTPQVFIRNGKVVSAMLGDGGTVKELEGYEPTPEFAATNDGAVWDKRQGTKTGGYVGQTWTPPGVVGRDADGKPLIGQVESGSGKVSPLDKADRSIKIDSRSVTNLPGQKQGFEEWSKLAAKTVTELSEQARNSVNVIGQINQLDELNKKGVMQGPLANPAVWLGQIAKSAGVTLSPQDQARLQNSETFGNTAAELWLATMNANGGSRGLVKEESERIANNLPALIQSPEGRAQIMAVMRKGAEQRISDARTAQREYGKALSTQNTEDFTFGLGAAQLPNTAPMPASVAPSAQPGAAPGVMTLEQYLKKK